jgi:xanthine dehydrogenase accessory factor
MNSLRHTAAAWWRAGREAAVIQVLEHKGSVPRETGTRMLVAADGEVQGTIGGGQLEWQAIARARDWLLAAEGRAAEPLQQEVPLGPALGQCCGGRVRLRTERLDDSSLAGWPEEPLLFHLQLYGAGHVGRAIAQALSPLACSVQWIDERDDAFPPAPLTHGRARIEPIASDAPALEARSAPPGSCFLVLTHSHALDFDIVREVLRRDDVAFLGLIGSSTKRARFEHQLLARGAPPAQLARLRCPIGVPGIRGKAPEVIAASVVAQLLQVASMPAGNVGPYALGASEPRSTLPPHSTMSVSSPSPG